MITVRAKLYATLGSHRPGLKLGESFPVELVDGATVRQLLHQLAVPENEVRLVFVNGIWRELDHSLADGDELGIFPPVGGG